MCFGRDPNSEPGTQKKSTGGSSSGFRARQCERTPHSCMFSSISFIKTILLQ